MAKVYLIYFDPSGDEKKYVERIVKIGDRLQIDKTTFLVKSDLSCVDLYDGFTSEPFDNIRVLISEINPQNTFGLWSPEIWKFLDIYNETEAVPGQEPEVVSGEPQDGINLENIPEA